jgi:hypothetical protein
MPMVGLSTFRDSQVGSVSLCIPHAAKTGQRRPDARIPRFENDVPAPVAGPCAAGSLPPRRGRRMENTREKTRVELSLAGWTEVDNRSAAGCDAGFGTRLSFRRAEIVAPVPLGVGCQSSITPLTLEVAGACRSSHLTSYPDAVEQPAVTGRSAGAARRTSKSVGRRRSKTWCAQRPMRSPARTCYRARSARRR